MKSQMRAAGVDTGGNALYVLATSCLDTHGSPVKALDGFIRSVTAGADLLTALMPEESIRNEALRYLGTVKRDMEGAGKSVPSGMDLPSPNGRGGRHTLDAQISGASPAQNSGGHSGSDVRQTDAPAGSQAEGGQMEGDAHISRAAPAREPTDIQKAAAKRVAKESVRSILDTFKITQRQGSVTPVGDISVASYGRMLRATGKRAWVSHREFNTIFLLKERADRQAHVPSGALTRDIFDDAEVLSIIKTAQTLATPHVEDNRETIDA